MLRAPILILRTGGEEPKDEVYYRMVRLMLVCEMAIVLSLLMRRTRVSIAHIEQEAPVTPASFI